MTRWARFAAAAAILSVLPGAGRASLGLDTIYLVRHAEKMDGWPEAEERLRPLSREGTRRAEALARGPLAGEGIVAVYTSRTTRTMATGLPLARRAGVPLTVSDASADDDAMEGFLKEIRRRHAGPGAVLIVGHSDTVPALLRRLGADRRCFDRLGILEIEGHLRLEGYDGLWRVDLAGEGCGRITRRSQKKGSG